MGLMSGRYQQRFGAECNVPTIPTPGYTKEDLGLDTAEHTLGDAMKAQGYRTIALGKWHLGELPKHHPNQRGFDEFFGFLGGSRTYFPDPKPSHDRAMRRNDTPLNEQEAITYLTDNLTDAALKFIDANKAAPFFMYLAYNAVHGPFEAKEEYFEQMPADITPESRRKAAAMTRSLDEGVGRLLDKLEALGLRENTLIFFLNDNGGTQGNTHNNGGLRGFKGTYWEGGMRVPFVVSWPAKLPQGKRYTEAVSSLDLLPTCVAAAGGQVPADWKLDGVNLLPWLGGSQAGAPHETLFWRFWRVAAVRQGPWKLLRVAEDPPQKTRAPILAPVLINLEEDPGETTNLAERYPEKTQELLRRIEEWEAPLAQPRWYDGSDWKHWQEEQVKNHRMDEESLTPPADSF